MIPQMKGKLSPAHKQWLDARAARIRLVVPIHTVLDFFGVEHNAPPGGDGSAHCPFHGEDLTPSAYVYGDTNKLFCHKCQQGWDVVGLVRAQHGGKYRCRYTKALSIVEKMFSLPRLPYPEEPDEPEEEEVPEEAEPDPVEAPKQDAPEPEQPEQPEPEPEPEPETESPEEDEQERKRRAWDVRRKLDRVLIEHRDKVTLETYATLCHITDRMVRHVELGLLTDEQIRERSSKIRRKLFRMAHA
jgi:hypothetical protein